LQCWLHISALVLQANVRFSDVVLRAYQPGDKVWVQDYHLMLLPSLLKAVVPKMKVGAASGSVMAQDMRCARQPAASAQQTKLCCYR
jgi:hypothetical protein